MSQLEVLAVASEFYPLAKTGGLADVTGALPKALKPQGVRIRTLIPGYPAVLAGLPGARCLRVLQDFYGGRARLLAAHLDEAEILTLEAPHLYDRPGGPYADAQGRDFADNAIRFAALGRAAASIGQGLIPRYRPDVLHLHDWQAGLAAAFLVYEGGPRPGIVCTIHNLAFQGQFDRALLGRLGLPPQAYTADGVEYYGTIGFLKAGVRLADRITTVSPTYAAEICTPGQGMGMDGLLHGRADRLSGILNGIDTEVWDPQADPLIAHRYADPEARAPNRTALQQRFQLDLDAEAPLFAVVSRLSWQKGLDLLLAAIPVLLAEGGQLAVLGSGDPELEQGFARAAAANPGRIGCVLGYDEALAHQMQAGADAMLVPSRFEPCGLTQLCALRYGAAPVVARVGGLADTVIDATPMSLAAHAATGVQFAPVETAMLEAAIRRTVHLHRHPETWRNIQKNGMASDVSWRASADRYAKLYRGLVAERAG